MKVAILFDPGGEHWEQKDVVAAVEGVRAVQAHLRQVGYETSVVPIRLNDWRGYYEPSASAAAGGEPTL